MNSQNHYLRHSIKNNLHLAYKISMKFFSQTRSYLNVLFSIFVSIQTASSQDTFHIYLVGDAGDHTETGETLKNLRRELISHPNSAVIFLGDNCYKDLLGGIIPFGFKGFDSSRNTMDKIRSQLGLADHYQGAVYFTPGNHDWWNRTTYEKGKHKLAMEESFIEENLKQNTSITNPGKVFLPQNEDYGPEWVELNHKKIRLIFIDTYRIIQTGIKKGAIPLEENLFYGKLDSVIKEGYLLKQQIFVIGHHPVYLKGPYNRKLKHPYLFARIKASNSSFPSYLLMASRISEVLRRYPGVYYTSGHVHALQYFYTPDSVHYIISGAGSKENRISQKDIKKYNTSLKQNEYLLWNSGGFFEVECTGQTTRAFLFYDNGVLKCSLP
jgi:hypothetical protein